MLLDEKYQNILPTEEYLTDHVILLNAWKKSHQHIRNINWYVDCLDLDKSSLELELRVSNISERLKKKRLKLKELKLIPAPKSNDWSFSYGADGKLHWLPDDLKSGGESNNGLCQPMRPLAHISIDDQTLFTALMMLLANKVETLQGDPSTHFEDVHNKKVINYGNRLHCTYIDSEAKYSWGNSNTYSKYFKDYQQFLARPLYFGKEAKRAKTGNEEIYEIHLDFSKFYDSIDRNLLSDKIKNIIESINSNEVDSVLKYVLNIFKKWRWSEKSISLYKEVCWNSDIENLDSEKGIPQGLVSGGFFANIYMLDFDRELSNLIGCFLCEGSDGEPNDLLLLDACRYVDDLRLIVKCSKSNYNIDDISKIISDKLDLIVKRNRLNLIFQPKKTKIKKFNFKEGAISNKLANIQSKTSGPISLDDLDEQLGHLEGLIELSDNLEDKSIDDSNYSGDPVLELALIDKTYNDVRKDTLLRFTANKIHNLLRQKRNMISQDVNEKGVAIAGSWDYLQEKMARKLIYRWTKDPSLLLLLKKGIELFPHVQLLKPILKNLDNLLGSPKKELKVFAEYCVSEILRHSATVIHVKDRWGFPAHSNVDSYFEYLENYACDKLNHYNYKGAIKEQLLFFCLVRNDSILKYKTKDKLFNFMTELLNGFRNISTDLSDIEFVTAVLLSYQVSLDKKKVVRSISSALDSIYENQSIVSAGVKSRFLHRKNLFNILERIMLGNSELFKILYYHSKKMNLNWISESEVFSNYLALNENYTLKGNLNSVNNKKISLLSVIRMESNPFKHENGILKLLESLLFILKNKKITNPIDISNTTITCSNWNKLLSLDSSCELVLEPKYYSDSEHYFHSTPKWLTDNHRPLYYIGMFIRSCLTGSIDWSVSHTAINETPAYRGIKTNMLKRQVGMMHSPEFFGESKSPMSNWVSSLLFKLLQWPGVEIYPDLYSWPKKWNLTELTNCIIHRIIEQRNNFCKLTNIPTYIEKVKLDWDKNKRSLSVMMVQPLLPLNKHFKEYGLKLDNPEYRARHRRHIASVSELILHHIASVDSMNEKPSLKGKVDLIIWPELSISYDDIDIIERLSDKTGAIIFSGIVFSHIKNELEINNSAVWIIPNKNTSGRRFIKRLQGKQNMTSSEVKYITPWRPYQIIVELLHPEFKDKDGFKLSGSVCYDATDIKLSADLKDKTNAYIISAMNKDISTFDSMVDSLFYHMYQHVVLVNSGEYGGSVAKAPYKEKYHKLITHNHGSYQVSISTFEMNMFDFRSFGDSMKSNKSLKTPPAGHKQ